MVKKIKFQSPSGMHDILPEEYKYFQKVYDVSDKVANFYNFQKIETPIVEDTELFTKGTGFSTDIVQKQMYNLKTKGGDCLTLRPEFTPGIARAYIEHGMHNMPQPVKLYSMGPVFRYENPQAGRYRQFHQVNFEFLGEKSAVADSQVIQIFYNILKDLKLKNLVVEINSIGDSQCRPYYKKLLVNYFKSREQSLCLDCRRRLKENPLRIFDCKDEKCQRVKAEAPQIINHLCEECHRHFKQVLEFLEELQLPYHLNPYLVRGLDYYTKTVFEISDNSEEGKVLGTLAAGGRYDVLLKLLGGKDTPALGGAVGVERVVSLMREKSVKFSKVIATEVFLAQLGDLAKRKSLKLIEEFKEAGIQIGESLGRDSLKAQLRMADKMGAKYTLILGQKEALDETIIIRDMIKGSQDIVKMEKVVKEIEKHIGK